MRPLAEKSQIQLAAEIPASAIRVAGDAAQIQQVITNLVSNAIGAMPGGGTIKVSMEPPQEGNRACIHVVDNGPGIDSAHVDHIFEPFYTTKDVGQGTGLGLSIAYGIVREHGGQIKVDSQPGKQTSFSVYLPVHQSADEQEATQ